jgi:hypothetical protein
VIDGVREGRHDPVLLASVKDAFTDAFHVAGLVGVAVMLVVLVLVARGPASPRHRSPRTTTREEAAA